MSKRLQVLLDEQEYVEFQGIARKQRMTLAEWVRQALREAKSGQTGTMEAKLRVIAEASKYRYPSADIDVMLDEIDAGRGLD